MTQALGLIEVIGYPPAVEAADSALKAANVKLGSITKVDGGIMTVQIFGDVGAVKAAVDAAGIAAARIGEVRATHVIPRVDPALSKVFLENKPKLPQSNLFVAESVVEEVKDTKVSPLETNTKKELEISEVVPGYDTVSDVGPTEEVDEVRIISDMQTEEQPQALEEPKKLSPTELTKLSNKELKNLIASLGIKVASKKLKSAKKEELIHVITQYYKEGEN